MWTAERRRNAVTNLGRELRSVEPAAPFQEEDNIARPSPNHGCLFHGTVLRL